MTNKDFIRRITETGKPLVSPGDAKELCARLSNAPSAYVDFIQSHTDDVATRTDHVCGLIKVKCPDIKRKPYQHAIFCLYMSSEYPLTMDELSRLNDLLFQDVESMAWGVKIDEGLGKEIRIDYALY